MRNDRDDEREPDRWPDEDPTGQLNGDGSQNGRLSLDGLEHIAHGDDAVEQDIQTGWVSRGGVLRWEEAETETDREAEIHSPLAADDFELPAGAPDAPRVRAVHAWLMRRRAVEHDALGELLLAQRTQREAEDASPSPLRRMRHAEERGASSLDLAIVEHQAAAGEYEALVEALDAQVTHGGGGHALVEYHLWLGEHLTDLAAEPEAATATQPPTTLAAAAWLGRAQAALAARGRVERVSMPEPED
jgi:hypothetical protein